MLGNLGLGDKHNMQHLFGILFCVGLFVFVIWLFWGGSSSANQKTDAADDQLLDPSDSRQIGLLIGMTGGSIPDAAVARFALERFEQIHGRKATTRDIATVVGLMSANK